MTDDSLKQEIAKLKKETRIYYFVCMFLIMVTIFLISSNTKYMSAVDEKIIKSQDDLSKYQSELSADIIEATTTNSKTILEIKSRLESLSRPVSVSTPVPVAPVQ